MAVFGHFLTFLTKTAQNLRVLGHNLSEMSKMDPENDPKMAHFGVIFCHFLVKNEIKTPLFCPETGFRTPKMTRKKRVKSVDF